MKRVGILSLYYKTYNFGAQLQSYALQKAIENMGYECEQIRFKWSKVEALQSYEYASVDHEKFREFSVGIPHTIKLYDADTIYECLDSYDIFVTGSDQIWGVEKSMPIFKLPVMSLGFVPENKTKIAYAASMGSSVSNGKIEEVLEATLPKLDAISAREISAIPFLEKLSGKKVENVLDPVMLLGKEVWNDLAEGQERSPYLFYYTVGANAELDKLVEGVAKKKKLQVIRSGYIQGESIGPKEFVKLIRDAAYVVSDSFHATVFAILFEKQFVTLPIDRVPTKRSRNARLVDLLEVFNLRGRYVDYDGEQAKCNEKVLQILDVSVDYVAVGNMLRKMREKSLKFLSCNLAIEKNDCIYVKKTSECSGCGVCMLSCPVGCISMEEDEFGFVFPRINKQKCIKCGKCQRVCEEKLPREAYNQKFLALSSKDEEVRNAGSSGGAFYELAKYILEENGLVVACKYDENFRVVHDFCEKESHLDVFCRSKYVQSNAYICFPKIKEELGTERKVLFVGTPCQTRGLTAYLGEVPDNLYRVDLVCGGVTAPAHWEKYLEEITSTESVQDVTMRHKYSEYLKPEGYPAFAMKVTYSETEVIATGEEDLFLNSRLSYYRDGCYQCKYKGVERDSDITIGDFCGMKELAPDIYDGKGTTLALVHTTKGEKLLNACARNLKQVHLDDLTNEQILNRNVMISEQMKRKAQQEYMRAIFADAKIGRLYYENKWVDEFVYRENVQQDFYREIVRGEMQRKLMKFQFCNLWIDDFWDEDTELLIYGAGKLGRGLLNCMKKSPKGFIDGNYAMTNCCGIPVYHMGEEVLRECFNNGKKYIVIITPIWDFDIIADILKRDYPKMEVVSLKELVGDLWI